jgi:UDP-GlcNAc:undecaprenyl-phosphate GlcNAc-1-phosphate transferase
MMILYAIAILVTTGAISWLLIPRAARLGLRLGLVDLPSTRRTRSRPIPTTGGMVVFLTTAAALLVAVHVGAQVDPESALKVQTLLGGGAVIVVLGMIDDRLNLRPRVKLFAQTAVAIAMVASGVGIDRVRFFSGQAFELGWLSYPVTVFWFVAFMNAINLVDGLDGLASGIAAIGATALFAVGILNDNVLLFLMAAGILGSSIGFLTHNFREGSIYLGDAGSMVLGFFLAGAALVGARGDGASNASLVAIACMAVPIFDVMTTIVRREKARSGVMTPDRSHTHHRLIRFGLNPRMTVVILWGVTLFFGGQVLGLIAPHGLLYLLGSYIVAAIVANVIIDQHRKNVRTIASDLRDEIRYLAGAPSAPPASDTHEGMTLRELIVAQIRREALYRRLARNGSGARRAPATTATTVAAAEPHETEATRGIRDELIMEGEETGREH